MDRNTAMTEAMNLWTKWVSAKPYAGFDGYVIRTSIPEEYEFYNLDLIHASMLKEARWHATGNSSASPALISEVKGELILLGKVRKALAQ